MNKTVDKLSYVILLYTFLICLSSCNNTSASVLTEKSEISPRNQLMEIDDSELINSLKSYNFDYQIYIPGNSLSYNYLWDGYDEFNKFGPKFGIENRLYTYLTEYCDDDQNYYAIYMKISDINESFNWVNDFDAKHCDDLDNYHFINNDKVIDGKYLKYAQNNNVNDFLVYYASSPSLLSYSFDDWQIVVCFQCKTLKIKENITLGKVFETDSKLLRRFELFYDEKRNELLQYTFETPENRNVNFINNIFSYVGRKIEAYPIDFESINFCYCPFVGLIGLGSSICKPKYACLIENKVILPRYCHTYDGVADLLNSDFDDISSEDVFRGYKRSFMDAYIKDYGDFQGSYKYGLYDYDKVCKIIYKGVVNDD